MQNRPAHLSWFVIISQTNGRRQSRKATTLAEIVVEGRDFHS
jgi:hypothetical protein